MVYWMYPKEESSLHIENSSQCSCNPEVRYLYGGKTLIIHQFIQTNEKLRQDEVEDYIGFLLSKYN